MSKNKGKNSELIDVLKRIEEKSEINLDIDIIESIVECEAEFTDNPDENRRLAKKRVRSIVEESING